MCQSGSGEEGKLASINSPLLLTQPSIVQEGTTMAPVM